MKIFTSKKGQLSQLKQQKFKLEKDIQRLFEENLTLLSGYIFLFAQNFLLKIRVLILLKLLILKLKPLSLLNIKDNKILVWLIKGFLILI